MKYLHFESDQVEFHIDATIIHFCAENFEKEEHE